MSTPHYFIVQGDHAPEYPYAGKYVSTSPPGTEALDPVPLERFANQFWFVQLQTGKHQVLSTEDLANELGTGATVKAIAGPFSTPTEASQSLERYWDMLMDSDDG